ncbi:hypothetical protein M404DRAFT_1001480 [Pisolithus tinctorius Marx 270]|uniref:Uncharacterized protein n=2 Tax=Pisolithus tinctorius Marx 270 TaxID=870435 RepID=A0A0C3P7V3_PISTI|nr:hypothetical protein M404DRAFT_1001480 [Pisolithus tinctorius Marx 270]
MDREISMSKDHIPLIAPLSTSLSPQHLPILVRKYTAQQSIGITCLQFIATMI